MHIHLWFSPAIIAATSVHGTKEKKVFWEFDSIAIMQNTSHNLLLFCAPTWPSHHMIETIYICVFLFFFPTGNAYQLSQLIRTLLDPENMALGANVRFSFLAKSRNFYYYSSSALSLLIFIIHQIFSLTRDWSKRVTWANIRQLKLGNIRGYSLNFKTDG